MIPAPNFVVFDTNDTVRAMLECKGAKQPAAPPATRPSASSASATGAAASADSRSASSAASAGTESTTPSGWEVCDCNRRVFSVSNVHQMLTVNPFPKLTEPRLAGLQTRWISDIPRPVRLRAEPFVG